jgi:hypothetical protein
MLLVHAEKLATELQSKTLIVKHNYQANERMQGNYQVVSKVVEEFRKEGKIK